MKNEKYTTKLETPIYEPMGFYVDLSMMANKDKMNELVEKIKQSSVSEEEKNFLIEAAHRHTIFNYQNIAEYYCSKASPEMQVLMEESALVIIDFNKAIENGYVNLTSELHRILRDDEA